MKTQTFLPALCVMAALCVMLLSGASAQARTMDAQMTENRIPVNLLLNPDGTLKLDKGLVGALDLAGWNVALDPQRGPILSPQTSAVDPQRGPIFSPNAPTADNWSGLGNGVNGYVYALAVIGDDVFVGGDFTQLCGNPACNSGNMTVNRIAKWSAATSSWSAVGNGVNSSVYALAAMGNDLYVGGAFTVACGNSECNAGNISVIRIAKWSTTTSTWSGLNFGVNSNVHALYALSGVLYVGGYFNQVCGNADCSFNNIVVNRIAYWSPSTSAWSGMGYGVDKPVYAIGGSIPSGVYVGGEFTRVCANAACNAGLLTANRIANWKSGTWSKLANGATGGNGVNDVVYAIVLKDGVILGGKFTEVCDSVICGSSATRVNHIAKWSSHNGGTWIKLGNGTNNTVRALWRDGNDIHVGGDFWYLCGNAACDSNNMRVNYIAKWTGSWAGLEYGLFGKVYALARQGIDVYAGGSMETICGNTDCNSGNIPINGLAKYSPPVATPTPTVTATPTKTATPTNTPSKTATKTNTPTKTATQPSNTCDTKPAAPSLSKPKANAEIESVKPKLDWNDVTCVTKFKVVVRRDAKNGVKVFKKAVTVSQVKTTPLEKGHTYYWRVKACNQFGCKPSVWSTFTIKP